MPSADQARRETLVKGSSHLVLVHDRIGGSTGMGRVAAWIATTALESGFRVTLVAADVDPTFRAEAEVVHAGAQRRLPALPQHLVWCAGAANAIRRHPADIVHVHAPALLNLAQVMTCHHLGRAAYRHGVRDIGHGPEHSLRELQGLSSRWTEDQFYRRRRAETRVTFVSELLRREFTEIYGRPTDGAVIAPPAPQFRPVSAMERAAARRAYGVSENDVVVGYLGGNDWRKGLAYIKPLTEVTRMKVLIAGPAVDRLDWPNCSLVGFVDADKLCAACDVVVAPALFDAAPIAVLEPLSRGIPVVVGKNVGWAPLVERYRAGLVWRPGEDLSQAAVAAMQCSRENCRQMVEQISSARQAELLLATYVRCLNDPINNARRRNG